MSTGSTRRSFLAMMGLGAVGVGAALAGCTPRTADSPSSSGPSNDMGTWDEEFDVVVCGAGIAGLSAAITVAKEGSGESCLLIEKETSAAGCSPVCAGDFLGRDEDNEYPL